MKTSHIKAKGLILLFILTLNNIYSQKQNYLQIDLSGGIAKPMIDFSKQNMFAERGIGFNGGFDYFFKNFGLGVAVGTFDNPSATAFSEYINHKYKENLSNDVIEFWRTQYLVAGTTYKLPFKNLDIDFYIKGGYSQINVPTLFFTKRIVNQNIIAYKFSGEQLNFQFVGLGGTRLAYRITPNIAIHTKAEFLTTAFTKPLNYSLQYFEPEDENRNGIFEDLEYISSNKIRHNGVTDLHVLNLSAGISFQIGRPKRHKPSQMLEPLSNPINTKYIAPEIIEQEETLKATELPVNIEVVEIEKEVAQPKEIALEEKQPKENKNIENIEVQVLKEPEPAQAVIAAEAVYDQEAAQFLYKAGESYFMANDFENAMPCFNKLKADPNYPRAKYMFALSLAELGNCPEAHEEYADFAKNSKETDIRTLEIIFASHLAKCRSESSNKKLNPKTKASSTNALKKSYNIQFVAIKKSNANFPKIAQIGNIKTEFFPKKEVYRYILEDYTSLEDAIEDMKKVRNLGFKDAFIAVYENGKRSNTLYHQK